MSEITSSISLSVTLRDFDIYSPEQYVHFLRNSLDYLPRKGDDDCLRELRWLYDRRDVNEARKVLAGWLKRWQEKYAKLCA